VEDADRILAGAPLDLVERAIDDAFGDRLLAGMHDRIHEFRDHLVAELGVRDDLPLLGTMTSRHQSYPSSCPVSTRAPIQPSSCSGLTRTRFFPCHARA
jgi:hypothetical protein